MSQSISGIPARLPNMLCSTSYAINKSNSKRITVGLECCDGHFRPVVKLCTSAAGHKNVTFNEADWQAFKSYFNLISAYFQDGYSLQNEYSRPTKVYMDNYNLMFTTSYNTKSIIVEEKPKYFPDNLILPATAEDVAYADIASTSKDFAAAAAADIPREQPPRAKKQKTSPTQSSICMQKVTFDGMKLVLGCVDLQLKRLEAIVHVVNAMLINIQKFLLDCIKGEEDTLKDAKSDILKSYESFEQYYNRYIENIQNTITKQFKEKIDELNVRIILSELSSFKMFDIVYREICSSINHVTSVYSNHKY